MRSTPTSNPASPFVLDACNKGGERAPRVVENTGIAFLPERTHDQEAKGVEVPLRLCDHRSCRGRTPILSTSCELGVTRWRRAFGHWSSRWLMLSPQSSHRGHAPRFGKPRRASLSEVQHRSWIANHPKNLCFNGGKGAPDLFGRRQHDASRKASEMRLARGVGARRRTSRWRSLAHPESWQQSEPHM
jgi:hypothetical protein